MITRFMRDIPLATIEIEMQLIPGFTPRACGTFRSQQRYVNPNPILYEELPGLFLKEIEIQAFALRVQRIIEAASNLGEREVNQMLFRNAEHKKRFQSICKSGLFPKLEESYGYAAAIFLLSADAFVWSKTKSCIDSQLIHFEAIRIHGVDIDGYAIFHMAKELYSGKSHITVSELSDPELINDKLLRLIVNAFLVRRYGIKLFPKDFGRYIEVFGGGGWVLFGRPPDPKAMEVYNDFNSNLANMFYCVKNRTWEFLRHLGFLPINSRDEFIVIRKCMEREEFDTEYLKQELELAQHNLLPPEFEDIKEIMQENAKPSDVRRAAAFFKLIRYSYGSGCTSYACQPFDVRKAFFLIWEASRRLANTVVENKDFEALIRQYDRDNAFFYCDPPYYETEGHYAVVFRKEDHARLRDTLVSCKSKWMVSYNDCEYIRELYKDFHILSFTRINNLAQRYDGGCEYPEVLITNYDPTERQQSESRQMNLFDYQSEGEEEDEFYRTNEMG